MPVPEQSTVPLDTLIPRWRELRETARAAREHAYAPYSKYQVGAAVLCDDGQIIGGCNVENASYGLTICAERVAVSRAIADGRRGILVVCVSLTGIPVPCGACRQVLNEFNPQMLVLLDNLDAGRDSVPEFVSLAELLPRPFGLKN